MLSRAEFKYVSKKIFKQIVQNFAFEKKIKINNWNSKI